MTRNNSFVNSMVRGFASQIGRDSARVITNSMYGNAHATPYRNTSSEIEVDLNSHNEKLTQDELNELDTYNIDYWCQKFNCTYSIIGTNKISKVYWVIWYFLAFMGPLGLFISIYKGYKHYNLKKKIDNERYIIEHPFIEEYTVIDNRTKTGYRVNKRKNVETWEFSLQESKDEWEEKEKKLGKRYFIVAFIALILTPFIL